MKKSKAMTRKNVKAYYKMFKKRSPKPQFIQSIKLEPISSADENDMQQAVIVPQKPRRSYLKKLKRAFKFYPKLIGYSLIALLAIEGIRTYVVNHTIPSESPSHSVEDFFDKNGNDFEVDDKNQIVVDQTTPEEKEFLTNTFNNFLVQDANTRNPGANINKIANILSINLVPFDQCSVTNAHDKYYVSLLFSDDKGDFYTLNYLTGKDFESDATLSKDFFTDSINFLSYNCALDSCVKMSAKGKAIKDALGDDVVFVGEPYLGFAQSGADAYYIPVYTKNGVGTTYYSLASQYYDEDPLDKFYESITLGDSDFEFVGVPFTQSENFQKLQDLLSEYEAQNQEENEAEIEK